MLEVGVSEYLLSRQALPDIERERLLLLEEMYDPWSVKQLDAIGVAAGWRCLDVGAGGGSVTRMLADRVGTGSVLAVDLDITLLEGLASDRVEVRRHDLRCDPLPADTFDLVHSRQLLMHLPARLAALRKLAGAARRGGWVAAMEPDFTTVELSPTNLLWERVWSVFCDALVAGGWDPRYGARLCGDLRAAGLVDVHADLIASFGGGGSLRARLLALTFERLRERLVALGADDLEIDEAQRLLRDRTISFRSQTTYVAYARRPTGGHEAPDQ
jgi:SAM-dependent methyltransferase